MNHQNNRKVKNKYKSFTRNIGKDTRIVEKSLESLNLKRLTFPKTKIPVPIRLAGIFIFLYIKLRLLRMVIKPYDVHV